MQTERPKARTFRDLMVWRKTHEFVLAVYRFTSGFPKSEICGLARQMRQAAVSIPANIAEGFTRRGKMDKARFMNIAESSLEESRYYLILAQDLGYSQTDLIMNSLEEVSRPLNAYAQAFWLPAPDFWLPYPAAFWRDIKGAALARHKRE